MGKSNKKVKSDRINALRKQYDAFLEEDKKRKERNEYILGKLDKMRYSTALVPVRHMPGTVGTRASAVYLGHPPDISVIRDTPCVNSNHQLRPVSNVPKIDDNYLVQEISKNYILIPKLRSPFMNNYIKQAVPVHNSAPAQDIDDVPDINTLKTNRAAPNYNENTDWKSKYEILNILKKEDQEKHIGQNADEIESKSTVNKEALIRDMNCDKGSDVYGYNDVKADIDSESVHKYLDELPEKDMPVEKVYDHITSVENIDNTIIDAELKQHNIEDISNEAFPLRTDEMADINYKLQSTNLGYNYSETNDTNIPSENTNYTEQEYNYQTNSIEPDCTAENTHYTDHVEPAHDTNVLVNENSVHDNTYDVNQDDLSVQPAVPVAQLRSDPGNSGYIDEQDVNPAEVISSSELMNEIDSTFPVSESKPSEYIAENHNIQELAPPNVDIEMKNAIENPSEQNVAEQIDVDRTSDQEPQIQSVTEIKDVSEENVEPVDIAGIEAFDTEQREMFYSENPDQQYGYYPGNTNVYEEAYQTNENYQSDQEYNYYDNTQPEAYPVNTGETEETTARYDQTYPQQYVDPYEKAYENQSQQPQQLEEPQVYNQMQSNELEETHGEQNYQSEDQIELALDTEQGYTETKNDISNTEQIEKPNAENKNMDQVG